MVPRKSIAHRSLLWLVAAVMLFVLVPQLQAFRLVPITMTLNPSGRGANGVFRVENESNEKVAVQISMAKRSMDQDGKETLTPATDDFVVFPPQIALDAKQSQVVRVRWVGNANLEQEGAYRVIAEQLPVNLSKGEIRKAKINLVVRYLGTVYITPKKVRPELVLDSVSAVKGDNGARRLMITFHNRGTAHALLGELKLHVTSSDKTGQDSKITLTPDQLKGVAGENVLCGHKRTFLVGWPENLKDGNLRASFEIEPGR